uniref:Uncharacterized protein n=2 Tax=Meloidogyne TaxID=189290 RepID=A0A6V7V729_MELEN|nr:unnamed protein product [Meloidogyne enterolobii]
MLIFIHLIIYLSIFSLQSLTTNVYGIEDHFNNKPLIINLNKRYLVGGIGEGGGDFAGGAGAPCPKGLCYYGGINCVPCRRPKANRYWKAVFGH